MNLKDICEGLPSWAHYVIWILCFVWEYWLGKTKIVKASSTIELILNVFKKENKMEVAKGLDVSVSGGQIVLSYKFEGGSLSGSYDLLKVAGPALDAIAAKVQSGEIDPVKGTDLDKEAMLKAIAFLKAEISK